MGVALPRLLATVIGMDLNPSSWVSCHPSETPGIQPPTDRPYESATKTVSDLPALAWAIAHFKIHLLLRKRGFFQLAETQIVRLFRWITSQLTNSSWPSWPFSPSFPAGAAPGSPPLVHVYTTSLRPYLCAPRWPVAPHRLAFAGICCPPAFSTCFMGATHRMNGAVWRLMSEPYPILFNKGLEELRRIGARGGRAHARNWRARQKAAQATAPQMVMAPRPPRESTAQAVATLDALFPWLRGAERRCDTRRR